jgi:hypothetical protein
MRVSPLHTAGVSRLQSLISINLKDGQHQNANVRVGADSARERILLHLGEAGNSHNECRSVLILRDIPFQDG